MASVIPTLLLLSLLGEPALTQEIDERIWSSVAWILHGERTPPTTDVSSILTPNGAQQVWRQGSYLRSRYLGRSSTSDGVSFRPLVGISQTAIHNYELEILSTEDEWATASAQAFMQGLYPPVTNAFPNTTSGNGIAVLADGSLVNYPQEGYQYPHILSKGDHDPDYIWVAGHDGCKQYDKSITGIKSDATLTKLYEETQDFYNQLHVDGVFNDAFPTKQQVSLWNVVKLYEWAAFKHTHDFTFAPKFSSDDLDILAKHAWQVQRAKNADLPVSGSNPDDKIRTVAGQTMAAKTVAWLDSAVRLRGARNKLNMAFTSVEPFLAFFGLAELDGLPEFEGRLPEHGAMIVFELFTRSSDAARIWAPDDDDFFPEEDDLRVRFMYLNSDNSTDEDVSKYYPLFGVRGTGQKTYIPWPNFKQAMSALSPLNSTTAWCEVCSAQSMFCPVIDTHVPGDAFGGPPTMTGPDDPAGTLPKTGWSDEVPSPMASGSRDSPLSPTVAGVVGAAVTIGILLLAVLAAMVFGRVRFHRADKQTDRQAALNNNVHSVPARRRRGAARVFGMSIHGIGSLGDLERTPTSPGGGGGFKGAEKMPSDIDAVYIPGGDGERIHQRTGSWELKDAGAKVGRRSSEGEDSRWQLQRQATVESDRDDDDAVSYLGRLPPVKPREF